MRIRLIAAAAALLALTSLTAAPTASAAPAPALSGAGDRVVTLPTGQQVALYGPAGAPTSFGPPPGVTWPADDPLLGASMNGHLYAFPASAVSQLGSRLESFDLTRLAGGSAAPAATTGGNGGGSPHNLWTLTINAKPVSDELTIAVEVQLLNVDDASRYALTTGIGPDGASFSVPAGHYSLLTAFLSLRDGRLIDRMVVQPEFTVSSPTTITSDASAATVAPTAAVSRPADLTIETMTMTRTARANGGVGGTLISQSGSAQLLVSPTAPVHVGSLRYDTYWHFRSPDDGASYIYDLAYPADGAVPAKQDHPAPADSALAAVDTHYAAEVPGTASAGRTVVDLAGLNALGFTELDPLPTPSRRTEYLTASPDVHWQSAAIRLGGSFEDWFTDAVRSYQPGPTTETWLRQPLVPGVNQFAQPAYAPMICPACRQGDLLNLIIAPYADSAGHVATEPTESSGPGDVASASYRLSSNGTTLATGDYAYGVQLPVPHAGAQYQLDYDVSRSAPWWTMSTGTHTTWTFSSKPANAALPPGWFCDYTAATQCTVLPLLFADYRLPVDDTGRQPAGPVTGEIDVHHLQGASQTTITSMTVELSFDHEQHWQPATVTAIAPGRYQVSYTNPTGASTADIRLTAGDAHGSTLSQTVEQAYAIAAHG